jgi:glutathione S-transferase
MLTLFDYRPSQNAWKVRQLLTHLGTPYRTEIVSIFEGEGQRPDYLAINPTGAVPAIRLDDGRVLAESNAILTYLGEGTSYVPDDAFGRAKVQQWLSFEGNYVEPAIGALRHWTLTGKRARRSREIVDARRAASMNALHVLHRELATRAFVAGDAYTIADISLFAYVSRADEADLPLSDSENIVAWIERVRAQPGFLAETFPYSIDPHSGSELS